jgi:predicted acetyltransferase
MTKTSIASQFTVKQIMDHQFMSVVDLWSFAYNIPAIDPVGGKEKIRDKVRDFCLDGVSYLVGAFEGEKLAACACIIDFDMHLGERWVKCGGIAGVATYAEYRRQRLVRELLKNCLQKLYEDRVPISALWPFSYSFYERLGWSVTDMRHQAVVALSALRTVGGDSSAYRSVSPEELRTVQRLHEEWSEQLNLSLRRNDYRWQMMMDDPRFRYRLFLHKDGYMLWNFGESQDRTLYVSEWCYTSDQAFVDGLALISQMDSQFDKVRMALPEIDKFLRIVGVGSSPEIKLLPGMMSRVVHLESFLECLPGRHKAEIDVMDPLGVTAADDNRPVREAGPGALMQHVTSFWKTPSPEFPEELYGVAANFPPFSIERY